MISSMLLGESPSIATVRTQVERLLRPEGVPARRLPPILILGETGTGKGLLAGAIQRASARGGGPFVDVNCAAIPETLLEAELFGFERGAFTDARQAKPGLFQAAGGGTMFLDEVGLLPLALQSKLLKVIEERQVRRLGSTRSEPLDVQIIAATSEDLPAAVQQGRFRPDLYHRLAVVTLTLPPLRQRGADVTLLADHFLARACEDYGLTPKRLADGARAALLAHSWPGNVRELANVVERAALLTDGPDVTATALDLQRAGGAPRPAMPDGDGEDRAPENAAERQQLLDALLDTAWNFSRAAARLGIPRNTLRYRAERLGLRPEASPARRRGGRPPRAPRPVAPAGSPPAPDEPVTARRITLLEARLIPTREPLASELQRALDAVVDKVRIFGGRVEELGPASLAATFGLDASEEAPRRAAHAAVAVQKLAARARAEDQDMPGVVVALHTEALPLGGPAAAPAIDAGAWRRARAGLVALLDRLEPGTVAATPEAASFLTHRFELAPAAADLAAYRLVGHAEPGTARFVGRDHQLRALTERFELAQAGHGQVVLVVGEPGIGKSRLLREFRRRLGIAAAWVEGQGLPFGQAMPFHPVIDMLRRSFRIDESDREAAVVDKIERAVLRLGEDLRATVPFLRDLLSIDPDDESMRGMDPSLRRAGIVDATHRVLERAAERQPHVVVVEDAHGVDGATAEWLARLADMVPTKRVLLLLTGRPEYRPTFGERSYYTRIALPALSIGESAEMACSALGVERLPAEVQALVAAKAEGNPFFVEEVLRSLQQVGALRVGGEGLALSRPLDEIVVPDTVQDVILARIERLGPGPRSTLQLASVIGREFPRRLLERIADDPEAVDRAMGELRAAELVYDRQLFPERVHVFKHALTQDVAYGTLTEARRRALHGRIGAALEDLHGDRAVEQAPLLAHHFARAERWAQALRWLLAAADQASRRFAIREALALYAQALDAAVRLGDRGAATTVHMARTVLHFVVSDFEQSREEAERWLGLARELGDREAEARALAAVAWTRTWAYDLDGAVAEARRAIDVAGPLRAEAVLARSHFTIGFVRAVTGGLDEARAHLERARIAAASAQDPVHLSLALTAQGLLRNWEGAFAEAAQVQTEAVALARRHQLLVPLLFGFFLRGLTLTGKGDYTGGLADFHEGLALAEKVGDETIHHRLLNCLGWLHLELGDLDTAAELNQQSAQVGRRRKDPATTPNAELNLGDVFIARGDLALAQEFYEGVDRYAREPGTSQWMRFRYSMRLAAGLGEIALARGDPDTSRRQAERCLEAATRVNARKNLVRGWRLAGEVATALRRWDEAERALRTALTTAQTIGNPPQLWRTWAALARLAAARGQADEARRARSAARGIIEAVAGGLRETALLDGLRRLAIQVGGEP